MKAIMYYALTGMLKVEEDALETLKKRLSIIAERRPELCDLIIEGIAVSAHVFNNDKLCKLLGVKAVENVKCHIETGDDLCQVIYVDYDVEGKHCFNAYPLPFNMNKLKDIFDVEYV